MWSAIKSDLFDFVSTIQEDTTKTLSKVLGEENDEVNIANGGVETKPHACANFLFRMTSQLQ